MRRVPCGSSNRRFRDARLRKLNLSDRSRDDEDADVVGEWIGRDHEKTVAVGSITQRSTRNNLVVDQRDLDTTAVLRHVDVPPFDVPRVPREVANEEDTLQPRQRNDDAFMTLGGERRPRRKLRPRRAEILRVSLE